jgi:hypothetical protein
MKKIFAFLLMLMLLTGAASATYTAISKVVSLDNENDYASAPASWDTLLGNGSVNFYAWPGGYDLILMVNVTGVKATNYLNVMAGDNPPAFRSDIGNLTISTWTDGGNEVRFIGPLESARFMNSTGYLQVSSKNLTGKLAVLKVAS